jgi:hypothetical protein
MTQFWFRPKRYGYGATPVTWEGWLATVVAGTVVAASIVAMNVWVDRANLVAWIIWAAVLAVLVLYFVQFCRRRTDGDWQWRWGESSNKTEA